MAHLEPSTSAPRRATPAAALMLAVVVVTLGIAGGGPHGSADAQVGPTATRLQLIDVTGARVARTGSSDSVTATVVNSGPTRAEGVVVRYRLPDDVLFDPAASSPGCAPADQPADRPAESTDQLITCSLGDLVPGGRTPVSIGVLTDTGASPALGTRAGYFLAPLSGEFDPDAGEVRMTWWNHEAGAQGTPLVDCWPITNPTPNMDVDGGTCDGTNDSPPLSPEGTTVLAEFPPPFSESVTRSWQFETRITAPETGRYQACAFDVDDGGYLAITPAGAGLTAASIVLEQNWYGSTVSGPIDLTAGRSYDVLIRVSNRGAAGTDNGSATGELAGWTSFGIGPVDGSCDDGADTAFGIDTAAMVDRSVADTVIAGSTNLRIAGTIDGTTIDGSRRSSARLHNLGPDPAAPAVQIELPDGANSAGTLTGCNPSPASSPGTAPGMGRTMRCGLASLESDQAAVISVDASPRAAGWVRWAVSAEDTVDPDPRDNSTG